VHSVRKYNGAYTAVLGGVDVIVFTAGIGENNWSIRARAMEGFEYLGAKLDPEKNRTREEAIISTDDSKVKICVIPTNEEIVIARDTLAIVEGREITD
jgi:acetate kinase